MNRDVFVLRIVCFLFESLLFWISMCFVSSCEFILCLLGLCVAACGHEFFDMANMRLQF